MYIPDDFMPGDRVSINTTYPGRKDRHGAFGEVVDVAAGHISKYIRVRMDDQTLVPYGFPLFFLATELTHEPHPTRTEWTRP